MQRFSVLIRKYSQAGNKKFPRWELIVPMLGIKCSHVGKMQPFAWFTQRKIVTRHTTHAKNAYLCTKVT
jgi:hypothetical protein